MKTRIGQFFGGHPLLWFAFAYSLACLLMLNPTIHGNDGHGNYAYLRSLLFDHDLNFENDYALFDGVTGDQFRFRQIPIEANTGLPGNRYGIGSAILWLPLVAPVRAWGLIRHLDETGLERRYVWSVGIASALWAGLALAMLLMLCREVWNPAAGWIAVAAALMLSPLPFYIFFHTSMSHATAFFAVTGFLVSFIKGMRSLRLGWFLAMGVFAGLAVMVRYQDAAIVIAVFAYGAIHGLVRREDMKKIWQGLFWAGVVSLIVFLPQMIVWRVLYGSPFSGPAPYLRYSEFSLLKPVHAMETLFSSNHGLFFWHPLLALGLLGLCLDLRRERATTLPLLLSFLATWHIASCWEVWFAGASFGNRFYLSTLGSFAAGFAAFSARLRAKRHFLAFCGLIMLGGIWNAGLAVQYGTGMIPRQGEVGMGQIVANQFTRVPELLVEKIGQAFSRSGALSGDKKAG